MASLNKVMLIGNIANEPVVRVMPDGATVVNFEITSCSDGRIDRATGRRTEQIEWHKIVCGHKIAEFVREVLGKGQDVFVEGKLRTRRWKGEDGTLRYTTEIVAEYIQLLGPRTDEQDGPEPAALSARAAPDELSDDDVPY